MPSDRIPPASDFSTAITGGCIRRVLEVVSRENDKTSRIEALRKAYFLKSPASQQVGRAKNIIITLPHYGLADDQGALTELGDYLLSLTDQDADIEFARHCIVELRGMDVLRAIRDLQRQHTVVKKETIQTALEQGFGHQMSRYTTDHLTLLNWMRRGGVISKSKGYEIDDAVVSQLAGVSLSDLDAWQALPLPQQAFLTSLRWLADAEGTSIIASKRVKDHAEITHGSLFGDSNSRKVVQHPLEQDGWLIASGATGGRGSKGGLVEASPRLLALDPAALLGFPVPPLPADLRVQLNKPLAQIAKDLKDPSKFVAGIALELLALRMSVALGLVPVELRKRDDKTGGGEVDLLAEGAHLHFSRWLFQCKNQRVPVPLSALAKEIGMAVLLKAHVIVIATTGRFSTTVEEHARQVAETTGMQVVLMDGVAVRKYLQSGETSLRDFFHKSATHVLNVKRGQRQVAPLP